jgi:DNA helicase-2/ATP-dependent DNA helicase PcrA
VVILLWVNEGMFPSARSVADSPEAEAEERRLFYVAVTRAKDELIFCAPEVRRMADGGMMHTVPSRFIREIPKNLLTEKRVNMPFSKW